MVFNFFKIDFCKYYISPIMNTPSALSLLTNIDDISYNIERINKTINTTQSLCIHRKTDNMFIIEIINDDVKNHHLTKILSTDDTECNFIDTLLLESELFNMLKLDKKTITKILNEYTNSTWLISHDSNSLLIGKNTIDESMIKLLLDKNLNVNNNNYKALLKLSIIYKVFDITKIIMDSCHISDNDKTKYNIEAIKSLHMTDQRLNLQFAEQIEDLFDIMSDRFYNSKYCHIFSNYNVHILHKLTKNGYYYTIKYSIYHGNIAQTEVVKLLVAGTIHNYPAKLYKMILSCPKYNIHYSIMALIIESAIQNNCIEIVKTIMRRCTHFGPIYYELKRPARHIVRNLRL